MWISVSQRNCRLWGGLLGAWVLASALAPEVLGQTKYKSANEAYSVGAAFYNSRNFAASREPFEAALKLAPDDAFRIKVYEALLASYRELPDSDKFIQAAEFIITKSEQAPKQSLTRRALLGFLQNRGLTDTAVQRYEGMLRKNPRDRVALYILSDIYSELKREPQKSAPLVERLAALDKTSGKKVDIQTEAELAEQYAKSKKFQEAAEIFARIAPQDPKLAAWHFKQAAVNFKHAGQKDQALAMAKAAQGASPETRSELLTHFWNRHLGELYLDLGHPDAAIPLLEKAIATTTIDGYVKDCQKRLTEAKSQAGK